MSDALALPNDSFEGLSADVRETIAEHAYAKKTASTYRWGWSAWEKWAKANAVPPLPADPIQVANCLDALARDGLTLSSLSIVHHAVIIRHRGRGLPYASTHPVLVALRKGLRRKLGVFPLHQKDALTADLVRRILPRGGRAIDLRDRAIILLGFLSAMRRSEIVGLDVADLTFAPAGLDVRIRHSKTDQEGIGRLIAIPYDQNESTCAVRAVRDWLSAAAIIEGPIFRRVTRWGVVGDRALSPAVVARIVKSRCLWAGLDAEAIGAHSLRAGFVTEAAQRGKAMDRIMAQTGHRRADQVLQYIRRVSRYEDNAASGLMSERDRQ